MIVCTYVYSRMYKLFNKNFSRQNYLDLRPPCNSRHSLIICSFLVLCDFLYRHLVQNLFAKYV